MRPSKNVAVDTASMNMRGVERSTPSWRLFGGGGRGQRHIILVRIRQLVFDIEFRRKMLTGGCRGRCHKGRRRLLEKDNRVWVEGRPKKIGTMVGRDYLTLVTLPETGKVHSPKTIPTRRLLYAVALFVSYSSNKSPATESDMIQGDVLWRRKGGHAEERSGVRR